MQPLTVMQAQFLGDHRDDGGRHAGAQGRLGRPQGLRDVLGYNPDQALRIETKTGKAVIIRLAAIAQASPGYQNDRLLAMDAAEQSKAEAEGRGKCCKIGRDHFMQGTQGQAIMRQMGIERRQAERQNGALCRIAFQKRQ